MQLKINKHNDVIIEWIPFKQFVDIKKIGKDDSAPLYSAIWKDGLLEYNYDKMEQKRIPNKEVALKYLSNSQNNDINNEFLNEIKSYFAEYDKIIKIYGISQSPATNDYIIVLQNVYCGICNNIYKNIKYKWCKQCLINDLKQNFTNWTSENEKIDEFIQQMQLEINRLNDTIIEWIPLNQFNNIKALHESNSAIFVNGPLCYNYDKMEWERKPNEKVTLICLDNLQYTTDEFLNEIKTYITEKRIRDCVIEASKLFSKNYGLNRFNNIVKVYGISQNPDSKDYIIVLQDWHCENCGKMYKDLNYKWCNSCQINNLKQNFVNWTSGNEIIDEVIQCMQLRIEKYNNTVVEWIPYNQFNNIKEIVQGDFFTLYLANWMNGPLQHDYYKWKRIPNIKVALKYLHNSQDITEEFLNEQIKPYDIVIDEDDFTCNPPKIYGISQNPNTKNYLLVLEYGNHCEKCGEIYTLIYLNWCESCQINNLKTNFANWTSRNKIIDKFIQGMQLEFERHDDTIFEWIPYNQFNNIKKIGKSDLTLLYSAIWINGPLKYMQNEWERIPNREVALKCLYNSQNITNKILNKETEFYSIESIDNFPKIYGISQNPDTKNYILVIQDGIICEECINIYTNNKWCKTCQINNLKKNFVNWTSGNNQIDELIQEMQLKIKNCNDIIVEWIPYNQLNEIKKVGKNDSAPLYSAIWTDGSLKYNYNKIEQKKISNKEVTLKYLVNSQNNITNEFLNKV
uniref:Protein kinase domain-containing protein n=1 Tax=Rhizophagus irregularis (strain DAOM 181602 / DAOM 197198 / MUCL 43194) TaxID=747089 RepID=U9TAY4_RHIID